TAGAIIITAVAGTRGQEGRVPEIHGISAAPGAGQGCHVSTYFPGLGGRACGKPGVAGVAAVAFFAGGPVGGRAAVPLSAGGFAWPVAGYRRPGAGDRPAAGASPVGRGMAG